MHITCSGVARIAKGKSLTKDGPPLEVQSIHLPLDPKRVGTLFYTALGRSAGRVLGHMMSMEAGAKTKIVGCVISFEAAGPSSNSDGRFRTAQDISESSFLDFRNMTKEASKVITPHWEAWCKSDDIFARHVEDDLRKKPATVTGLQERVSNYPVFFDYLRQQDEFKHIEASIFTCPMGAGQADVCVLHKHPQKMLYQPVFTYAPGVPCKLPDVI